MLRNHSFALLAAGLVAFSASKADALSLRLTDLSGGAGSTQVNDSDGDNAVTFNGAFGNFNLTLAAGFSNFFPPLGTLFSDFTARSSGAGKIQLELSEVGYNLGGTDLPSRFVSDLTSNSDPDFGRTVTINTYADSTNTLFGTDTLLAHITGGVDALVDVDVLDLGKPFALTHVITIDHTIGGVSNGDADTTVAPVPVPAALPLLGAALGLMGLLRRRRAS